MFLYWIQQLLQIIWAFLFNNIPSGEHEVQFNYSSADTIINKTELVEFKNQSIDIEFFLYKKNAQLNTELFPLAVGNIWVYMLDDLSKEYWEVIGIEVVDNLISYKMEITNPIKNTVGSKVYTFDMNSGYLNLDGSYKTNLNYPDGNYEVKDSNGNTYLWIHVTSSNQTVFGENTFTKRHYIQNQEVGASYSFANGIGIVGRNSAGYLGYGAYHSTLIGAIIDNVEYGDTSYVSYNKELAYYPMAIGYKWFYRYTETTSLGDTLKSTYLKREIINKVVLGNDKSYYEIKNTFSDSSTEFFDWQRIDSTYVKLYGYSTIEESEYLIDELINSNADDNNHTFYASKSHMPSILPYGIYDFESKYPTTLTKTYYGWSYDLNGNPFNNTAFYEFTKNIGISKIIITLNDESPATIKELNLIGSIINGNVSGVTW